MGIANLFYDKTCSIYRTSYVVVNWSEVLSHNLVYSNIPCSFWLFSYTNFVIDKDVREQDKQVWTVDLQPAYISINKWDNIEITDEQWLVWNYVVNSVSIFKKPNGNIDNISLTVSSRPELWS